MNSKGRFAQLAFVLNSGDDESRQLVSRGFSMIFFVTSFPLFIFELIEIHRGFESTLAMFFGYADRLYTLCFPRLGAVRSTGIWLKGSSFCSPGFLVLVNTDELFCLSAFLIFMSFPIFQVRKSSSGRCCNYKTGTIQMPAATMMRIMFCNQGFDTVNDCFLRK